MPGKDRKDLRERQRRLLSCVRDVAARAEDAGVRTTFHPNSPEGSLFRTSGDYEILVGGLPGFVGFTPDLGHVARGGMDPLAVVKQYRERVNHVHAKDMDDHGRWARSARAWSRWPRWRSCCNGPVTKAGSCSRTSPSWLERDPDGVAAQLGRYVEPGPTAANSSDNQPPM